MISFWMVSTSPPADFTTVTPAMDTAKVQKVSAELYPSYPNTYPAGPRQTRVARFTLAAVGRATPSSNAVTVESPPKPIDATTEVRVPGRTTIVITCCPIGTGWIAFTVGGESVTVMLRKVSSPVRPTHSVDPSSDSASGP